MAAFPYQTAIVTGASRGIGRALAERLAQEGLRLLLCARQQQALSALATHLHARHHVEVQTVAADLSTAEGIETLVQAAEALPVDLLINNAGVGLGGPFYEQSPAELQRMLALNVVGLTQLSRRLLPRLLQRPSAVVNIGSQAAFFPVPYMAAYAASKAYVLHLSEAMAEELANSSVHVLALCPGPTQTDFFDQAHIDVERTRLAPAPIDDVVEEGLAALRRRERVRLVGTGNRWQAFGTRFLPRRAVARIGRAIMQR